MAYIETNRKSELNTKQDDLLASKRYLIERKPETVLFYELEAAVVLDIILSDDHPAFSGKTLDPVDWPVDANGEPAKDGQPDYGWIGMVKFRLLNSQVGDDKEILSWAAPMENTGVTEYPLLNEVVVIGKYLGNYYYSKKLNIKSSINANASFELERAYGQIDQNQNEYSDGDYYDSGSPRQSVLNGGPKNQDENPNYVGTLGQYFKFNPAIRALKRYEGDSVIESRFGSSIRFAAYDWNPDNDFGVGEYEDRGGNPMMLIRNRQAPVKGSSELKKIVNKGYVTESINNDGSSIHMTSGVTVSDFLPTTKKSMFSKSVKEEQSFFSPDGSTEFDYPTQDGDQIVINSDRLIFSSKANETFHFSKKRYSIVTDDEFTIDAQKQVVITTNKKMVINSPFIHLGEYDETSESVLLGNSTTFWLNSMCDWLYQQTEWMINDLEAQKSHKHNPDSRGDRENSPDGGSISKIDGLISKMRNYQKELRALQDKLPALLSQRVFTVGGGWAPGQNGGELSS